MLKVRPKLHLVTFYKLLPIFALAIALGVFSFFGISESFFYGTFIYIIVTSILLSIMALFEPIFSEITITENKISYLTSIGGEIEVDLYNINEEESVWDDAGLTIVDINGNKVFISKLLFSKSDIERVFRYISEDI